jgi:hypothetical protein
MKSTIPAADEAVWKDAGYFEPLWGCEVSRILCIRIVVLGIGRGGAS